MELDEEGDGGQGRDRTADTRIFSPLLYQLSYLADTFLILTEPRHGLQCRTTNFLSIVRDGKRYTVCNSCSDSPVDFSISACRLLPCASMVTMAAKLFTFRCHIASGMPSSNRFTSITCSTVRA